MLGVLVGKLSLTNACLPIPPVPLETLIQALQFVLPSPLCPWDLCISCTQEADRGLRLVWKTLGFCKITHYTFLLLEACSHFQMDTIVTASPCKFWTWETQVLDGGHWLWPVCLCLCSCITSCSHKEIQVFHYLLPCLVSSLVIWLSPLTVHSCLYSSWH